MKSLMLATWIVVGALAQGADTKLVAVQSTELFVPVGFDDNDESQVILEGYLPDTCHRVAPPTIKVTGSTIHVQQMAYLFTSFCFDVTVPYTSTISLGRLSRGNYTVTAGNGGLVRNLEVNSGGALPGPDDYLYAPIDVARIEKRTGPGGPEFVAILEGRFTNSCMRIVEIRTFDHTATRTVEMLPIVEIKSESGEECKSKETNFRVEGKIPEPSLPGRYLLHVRSLNGSSINAVFTN